MLEQDTKDSFIYPERQQQRGILKVLQKFDFFSFIPVPKDQPISTKRSIIGSCIFIILFLAYVGVDLYQFITDNPPIVQNSQSSLDNSFYTLPRAAITFMNGEYLNLTGDFSQFITYSMTKQLKDNSVKNQTPVVLSLNNKTYLQDWLGNNTLGYYQRLLSPAEQMSARGLLYSTQNANFTKITVRMCNVSQVNNSCESIQNITSFLAKGRIFLFIQQTEDQSQVSKESNPNKFRIANFFLIPRLYKRVTIQFQVIKSTVFPDYFHHWTERKFTKLELYSITQQTSDTSINDKQKNRQSLQMLGITFQLAAQILNVRVVYSSLLDHVAKWGAFFNVLFAVFAIFFLAYNQKKFYQRNPDWNRFKNRKKSDNMVYSDALQNKTT